MYTATQSPICEERKRPKCDARASGWCRRIDLAARFVNDAAPEHPGPRSTESDLPSPGSLSALYLRVADALERAAALAEHQAERLRSSGDSHLAGIELQRAERARQAAKRGRALAS